MLPNLPGKLYSLEGTEGRERNDHPASRTGTRKEYAWFSAVNAVFS